MGNKKLKKSWRKLDEVTRSILSDDAPRKKKKRKYEAFDDYPAWFNEEYEADQGVVVPEQNDELERLKQLEGNVVPERMLLDLHRDPGIVFGRKNIYGTDKYIGIRQGEEGNSVVIGPPGSSKTEGIVKPTMGKWGGTFVALDVKGELSEYYTELFADGIVERPYNVFDPMNLNSIGYDPFWLLKNGGEENLVNNIWEIVQAIIPVPIRDSQPFWVETEQGILAAGIRYYYRLGLSFSETMLAIVGTNVTTLVNKIMSVGDAIAKMYIGELATMKDEVRANFDRGLRNKLMLFATDPYINNAFRDSSKDASCFHWGDLDKCNLFIKIPAERIEQWGGAIRLMLTQAIRFFERRPEMHSAAGKSNIQTLFLLDEFARFGKLEMISSALATLRSKNVNFLLVLQSIAQLDKHYGQQERDDILDNCQYQAILRVNGAETAQLISSAIGTTITPGRSMSLHYDGFGDMDGRSLQVSENREPRVFPHDLRSLQDVILLHPWGNGFCRLDKITYQDNFVAQLVLPEPRAVIAERM